MQFKDTPEDAAFRAEVRAFVAAELPQGLSAIEPEWGTFNTSRARGMDPALLHDWRLTLAKRGWLAPHWPKQYGGARRQDAGACGVAFETEAQRRAVRYGARAAAMASRARSVAASVAARSSSLCAAEQ